MGDTTLTLDDAFVFLRVLGGVQANMRVATASGTLRIEDNTYLLGIKRIWNGESRKVNTTFLEKMFDDIFSLIASKMSCSSVGQPPFYTMENLKEQSREALQLARAGLMNLCQTYEHDINVVKRIEWLVLKVDGFVTEVVQASGCVSRTASDGHGVSFEEGASAI